MKAAQVSERPLEADGAKKIRRSRGVKRWIIRALIAALTLAVGLLLFRAVYREAARTRHRLGPPGVDAMETVEIGGIQQVLYMRGENAGNPVILFLHGGPGVPILSAIHRYQYDWEKDFTVINWDQRLAGKTFFANDPEAVRPTMSFERALEDAWEVTQYVRKTLGQEKIIVMGHSWGSALGTALVQTHPEAFSAYIGVGQLTNMVRNERAGFEKVLALAKEAGQTEDVAELMSFEPYPSGRYDESFTAALGKMHGYRIKYKLSTGTTLESTLSGLLSPYYTLRELGYYNFDIAYYQTAIAKYLYEEYDARLFGVKYGIPVFYITGVNDTVTPLSLAQELFAEIEAPVKRFFPLEGAAHVPMYENRAAFTRILLEEILPQIEQ